MDEIIKLKKEKEDWLFIASGLWQGHQESLKNDLLRKADNIQWQIDELKGGLKKVTSLGRQGTN